MQNSVQILFNLICQKGLSVRLEFQGFLNCSSKFAVGWVTEKDMGNASASDSSNFESGEAEQDGLPEGTELSMTLKYNGHDCGSSTHLSTDTKSKSSNYQVC